MFENLRSRLVGDGLGYLLMKAIIGSAGIRIAGMGFGFLVGIQLARSLGVEGYGVYGLAMSIISLLTIPTEFGLPQLITREVASNQVKNQWDKIHGVIRWAKCLNLKISLFVSLLMLAWLMITNSIADASSLGFTLLVGMTMIPLVGQSNLRGAALRGLQHIVKGQLPDVLIRPVIFSFSLLAISFFIVELTPAISIALGSFSVLVSLILSRVMLNKVLPVFSKKIEFSGELKKNWLSSAFPMALTQGMHVLQSNTALLLLGLISTAVMVGSFKVATSIVLLIGLPITLINIISAPLISRSYTERKLETMQYLVSYLSLCMLLGASLIALPVIIYGYELIAIIFGDGFSYAYEPLRILCIGIIFCSALGPNIVVLNMCGHEKRVTRAFFISLMFLMMTSVPLIYFYGASGAAFCNAASMLLWNFILYKDSKMFFNIDTSILFILRNAKILLINFRRI